MMYVRRVCRHEYESASEKEWDQKLQYGRNNLQLQLQ